MLADAAAYPYSYSYAAPASASRSNAATNVVDTIYEAIIFTIDTRYQTSTGNLWKHYTQKHPTVAYTTKGGYNTTAPSSPSSSASSFFEPRKQQVQPTAQASNNRAKYRELLLSFVVSNNLSLRLIESYSFHQLVQFLSPSTLWISSRTLHRELQRQFSYHRGVLQLELRSHITLGGRISITTDAWTARNYTEYAAVTAHWINEKWQHRCVLLDIIHLKEPIHSGEYLAQQLAIVTDSFEITGAIFTCTRDNASANTVMLSEYEKIASEWQTSIQQPWTFTVKEGDVRCIAHIINIAVQAALKSLKASPETETEAYWCQQGLARLPQRMDSSSSTEVSAILEKLRRHIYVFRNRRAWKDALQKQVKAIGQKPQLDISMKDIALTSNDWAIIEDLERLFLVFLKPSRRLQSDSYPTLNFTIPLYLKMINKVKLLQEELGISSTIGLACGAALRKLNEYYTLATNQQCKHSAVATICDPRMNHGVFKKIYPNSIDDIRRSRARAQFEDVCRTYQKREYHLDTLRITQETALAEAIGATTTIDQEPDSDEDLFASEGLAFQEPEWRRWMLEPRPGEHTDILKYWCAKQYQYPVIARIARDHLAIPATSAASERVFSNGSDIITKKRNRLSPPTIRYLLCLRNWGKIQEANSDDEDADDEAEAPE
ncbi:hypothetical protein O988_06834 [Pseudogymnoascus sp. VKM F-3808]|nr:hypothetical protein O988_06834 [Pseudogymnoascus sp. VKM F-3808]